MRVADSTGPVKRMLELFPETGDSPGMTDKQMAIEALDHLPESASFQQIKEELDIINGLKRGLDASDAGQITPSAEVKEMVGTWFTK